MMINLKSPLMFSSELTEKSCGKEEARETHQDQSSGFRDFPSKCGTRHMNIVLIVISNKC